MIPKINKTYNCFDDGKISESRKYTVDITEVIPFAEVDSETLDIWNDQVKDCHWLFSKETDYFIKFKNGEEGREGVFARTKNGGWFGLGNFWNSGRLDVDGSLTDISI